MKPRTVRWIAWTLWAGGVVMLLMSIGFAWVGYGEDRGLLVGFIPKALLPLGLLLIVTLATIIVTHQPDSRVGWILLIQTATLSALQHLTTTYGFFAAREDLPGGEAAAWISLTLLPALFALLGLAILLFPSGRLPSSRWRPLPWIMGIAALVATIGTISAWDFTTYPRALLEETSIVDPQNAAVANAAMSMVVLCIVACGISLVVRLRAARGDERLQIKWVVFAATLALLIHPILISNATNLKPFVPAIQAPLIGLGLALAIFKYRLYDIDLVINKTLVYGTLAAFIGAVYVTVVVGFGELIGARANNVALSIAATVVVAVAFEPVRQRVQRFANRVVYGQRATPYEVMADFSHRMAGAVSIEELLPRTAETAATGVGAESSRVTLLLPDGTQRIEPWPAVGDEAHQPGHRFDVSHGDDVVGEISVAKSAGEPLTPAEERLLEDLASQAGLAFANARLTLELQDRLKELSAQTAALEASRARIVSAADTERRRLEKEIRTDVGEPLIQLQGAVREARNLMPSRPDTAATDLEGLIAATNDTLESLRDLARGVFPPLLADQGLIAALEALSLKLGSAVRIEASAGSSDARFPTEVEAALYFAIRSCLDNRGGEITVTLSADVDQVRFEVRPVDQGIEIQGMADRVAALGGDVVVESRSGGETAIRGVVPTRELQPA